jgi:hypothetical protein
MTYIKTIEPNEAQGPLKKIYEAVQEKFGMVPNVFSAESSTRSFRTIIIYSRS